MLERTFTEEQDSTDESPATNQDEPEYVFEGYNIEFSEKVMLTFPGLKRSAMTEQSSSSQFSSDPERAGFIGTGR